MGLAELSRLHIGHLITESDCASSLVSRLKYVTTYRSRLFHIILRYKTSRSNSNQYHCRVSGEDVTLWPTSWPASPGNWAIAEFLREYLANYLIFSVLTVIRCRAMYKPCTVSHVESGTCMAASEADGLGRLLADCCCNGII